MQEQDEKQLILFPADSHASRTVLLGNDLQNEMIDIYGQSLCGSSKSLNLDMLLEKMLMVSYQQYMNLFAPIWKKKVTKSGRTVYRLSLSERTMKDIGFVFLASPRASQDFKPIRNLTPSGKNREARKNAECKLRVGISKNYWTVHKPPLCGMADGIPDWMGGYQQYKERMMCYGNAVVPQQFYPVFQVIAEVMKGVEIA